MKAFSVISVFLFFLLKGASPPTCGEYEKTVFSNIASVVGSVPNAAEHLKLGDTGKKCEFKGIQLYGKVKFVESFPDIKIQFVESFPDINVQLVSSFPNDCGKWQVVESFPDFTVQVVESFPDLKVKTVESFAGME